MRLQHVAWMLAGAAAAFVACAAQLATKPSSAHAVDVGIDVAPATDAIAAPVSSTAYDVACDKAYSNPTTFYAELSLKGRSADSLAGTTVIECGDGALFGAPPGYSCRAFGLVFVKDAYVAAACASKTKSLRFIVPQP